MILDTACTKQMQISRKRTVTDARIVRCHGQDTTRLWLLSFAPAHYDSQTRTSDCRRPQTTARQGLEHAENRYTQGSFTRAVLCRPLPEGRGDCSDIGFDAGHQSSVAGPHFADNTNARSARRRVSGALLWLAGNLGRQRCGCGSATKIGWLDGPQTAAASHSRVISTFLASSPCSIWASSYKLDSK
jgi:hypothetical protein